MTIVAVIVVLLLALGALLLYNASRVKPSPIENPLPPTKEVGSDDSVARFQEMLQSPTIWGAEDPTVDRQPFEDFVPLLKKLYPSVFEKLELTIINDYGIMLRWPGKNAELDPIVLMAHYDVVEANPLGWTHPPFAAEIADGKIWARGTCDTKCILAGLLEATQTLLNQEYQPPRDVYICSSNCEEDAGDTAPKFIEHFKEQNINLYMVIDEGGAVIDNAPLGVNCSVAAVGVAEKGMFNAHVTTNSKGGHASTPWPSDATGKLIAGLDALQKNPPAAKLPAPVEAMLTELAAYGGFGLKLVFGNLWLFRPLVLKIMKGTSETAAMVRTTYAITELDGSRASNVLPKQAKATVNIRVDPSESVEIALNRLKTFFDDETEYETKYAFEPSPIAPFDDEAFAYLRKIINCVYPEASIAPYVQSSCSDARHFHRVCPRTYRFAGFMYKADQRAAIHGQDENLDVESFKTGVGFYVEFLRNLDLLGK